MDKPAGDIMTIAEVAEYLRISKSQCYALVKRGDIPSFHLHKSVRVRRADLLKWIEDRMD